jgi:hypothetical protein
MSEGWGQMKDKIINILRTVVEYVFFFPICSIALWAWYCFGKDDDEYESY